jgi:hypothetical protein
MLKQNPSVPFREGLLGGTVVGNRAAQGHRKSNHKCEPPPPHALFTKTHINYRVAAMELTHPALHRSDQKMIGEVKRTRNALEAEKSPLTKT